MRRPHVLITAGGTSEPLDDVRVLTNRSTGRLGLALARAFVRLGADVTVIGAAGLQHHAEGLPVTVRFVPFTTAASLDAALTLELAARVDVLLMAAAVADYLPAPNPGKLSSDAPQLRIDLHRAPKILPTLRARAGAATKIVGFKLLSGVSESELIAVGDRQRAAASLDATVANDQQQLSEGAHPLFLLTADGQRRFEGARDEVAAALAAALIPAAPPVSLPPARGPLQGRVSGWWEVRGAVERSTRSAVGLVDAWLNGRASPDEPTCRRSAHRMLLGGATWDAALAEHRLSQLATALPHAAPVLWDGEIAAGVGRSDGHTSLHTFGPPHGWAVTLAPSDGPLRLTGALEGWREAGWVSTPEGWSPPWRRRDVVPAASAVLFHRGYVLLGERRGGAGDGALAAPGGHAAPDERPAAAALRELQEETGIDLLRHPHRVTGVTPTWTGQAPCWRVDAVTIQVASLLTPHATREMDARWWRLGDALHARHLAPGLRDVLRHLPRW